MPKAIGRPSGLTARCLRCDVNHGPFHHRVDLVVQDHPTSVAVESVRLLDSLNIQLYRVLHTRVRRQPTAWLGILPRAGTRYPRGSMSEGSVSEGSMFQVKRLGGLSIA